MSFVEDDPSFLVLDDLTSKVRLVHELDLLQHLVAILGHLLVHDAAAVNVILHELFSSTELYVLVHELWNKVSVIHELEQVLLHDGVLVRCLLKA